MEFSRAQSMHSFCDHASCERRGIVIFLLLVISWVVFSPVKARALPFQNNCRSMQAFLNSSFSSSGTKFSLFERFPVYEMGVGNNSLQCTGGVITRYQGNGIVQCTGAIYFLGDRVSWGCQFSETPD